MRSADSVVSMTREPLRYKPTEKHPNLTDAELASGIEDLVIAHLIKIDYPNVPLPGWRTMTAANAVWVDQSGRLRVNLRPIMLEAYTRAQHDQTDPQQWLHLNLNPTRLFGHVLIRALVNRGWEVPHGPTRGRRYWIANPTLTAYLLDPTEEGWLALPGSADLIEPEADPDDEFTMDSISHDPHPTTSYRPRMSGQVADPLDDDEWVDPLADLAQSPPT